MVLISSWKAFPFYSLVILAALQAIPQELYEAAVWMGPAGCNFSGMSPSPESAQQWSF